LKINIGYIKEPKGIDLIVSPMPLSIEDREAINMIIKTYKLTGEILIVQKRKALKDNDKTSEFNTSENS
jgi:hypothetical protein